LKPQPKPKLLKIKKTEYKSVVVPAAIVIPKVSVHKLKTVNKSLVVKGGRPATPVEPVKKLQLKVIKLVKPLK
jgi:hypothetical protein